MRRTSALALVSATSLLLGGLAPATAVAQNLGQLAANVTTGAPATEDHALEAAPAQEATDRIVVQYAEGTSAAQREQALAQAVTDTQIAPVALLEELGQTGAGAAVLQLDAELTADDAAALADKLTEDPGVAWATPDVLMSTAATAPNDPAYAQQWGLKKLNLPTAWEQATGAGTVIGVVDTGSLTHQDLTSTSAGGYDFVSALSWAGDGDLRDANPADPGTGAAAGVCNPSTAETSSWHGAHVSGIAAAATNNGAWVAGVAPEAKILTARAIGTCSQGYMTDVADAIRWLSGAPVQDVPAPAKKADVINLSLTVPGACSPVMQQAIDTAVSRGTTVVAAAGNDNRDASTAMPANCRNVITVGSVGPTGTKSAFSNYGAAVDLVAPGEDIHSTVSTGTRGPGKDAAASMSGTSQATPHVAGTVALLKQREPALSPAQIEAKLIATATAVPGGKLLNPVKALAATAAAPSTPAPTPSAPPVTGKIGELYATHQATTGAPTGAETTIKGGSYQQFTHGRIYLSASGAHFVPAALQGAWDAAGGATGAVGFPAAAPVTRAPGGLEQRFATATIVSTGATGAHVLKGAVRSTWTGTGGATGSLGYPTSSERDNGAGGVTQTFQKGRITWSAKTGARILKGAIASAYAGVGAERGALGLPASGEVANGLGGVTQSFQKGRITWSAKTGARVLKGAIGARHAALGAERGTLGYPTADERCGLTGGGCYQQFQKGRIYWSSKTGTHVTAGAIGARHTGLGAERSRLGYPTGGEYRSGTSTVQNYQGGKISWSARTGVRVSYR